MRRLSLCLLLSGVLVLIGCGGGSSSSGAGSTKEAPRFAGQYAGFEVLGLSGPGGTFPVGALPLSVTIAAGGSVVVTDSDGIPYLGRLGGVNGTLPPNKFRATAFVSIPTPPGLVCQPNTFGYIGTVVGNVVTGNATGRFRCFGLGRSAFLTLRGPFRATKGAAGAPTGVSAPAPSAPSPSVSGNRRQTLKQKGISDGVRSAFQAARLGRS